MLKSTSSRAKRQTQCLKGTAPDLLHSFSRVFDVYHKIQHWSCIHLTFDAVTFNHK